MSVLSILIRGRQAKEHGQPTHSEKQAGKQKEEQSSPRYRHFPTHAGVDALLCGPVGWMQDDAQRIRDSNLKRMAASAAQTGRISRPSSAAMLSPLHTEYHTRGGGSSSSSSSRQIHGADLKSTVLNSSISPRWSQPSSSSLSAGRYSSSQPGATIYSSPDYSSLDAEIDRARRFAADAGDTSQTAVCSAPVPAISPSPSLTSSSMTLTPASSPSPTPISGSTLSLSSFQSLKKDSIGVIYEEHSLSHSGSFEMKLLPTGTKAANTIDHSKLSPATRPMRNQPDLSSAGHQEKRQPNDPYAQPAGPAERLSPRLDKLPAQRSLVPATLRPTSHPSPTLTDKSLDETPETPEIPEGSE
ncbi:hypothetical protein SEPCBS119000_006068 [Sporothrix epigloea]|uniref:Uncharacterized protein n=1 Tax=Sporothrix epigloea TaxID=1892477 RepID=A0ABP0E1D3_9PEZI